jgi:hypothetical protein
MIEEEFGGKINKRIGNGKDICIIPEDPVYTPSPEEPETVRPVAPKRTGRRKERIGRKISDIIRKYPFFPLCVFKYICVYRVREFFFGPIEGYIEYCGSVFG